MIALRSVLPIPLAAATIESPSSASAGPAIDAAPSAAVIASPPWSTVRREIVWSAIVLSSRSLLRPRGGVAGREGPVPGRGRAGPLAGAGRADTRFPTGQCQRTDRIPGGPITLICGQRAGLSRNLPKGIKKPDGTLGEPE